ncbi:hypothetical protein [Nocardioides taihuensis]|uniref:SMODS and SLOG-associating 2TM effector domain-containing protein n=1 Tax=Nocardioides taihuensis TaxID=1835606 RepID=A0ABW0BIN1_9ACTN
MSSSAAVQRDPWTDRVVRVQRDLVATSRHRVRARRLHQMLLWLLAGLAALTCVALLVSEDYRWDAAAVAGVVAVLVGLLAWFSPEATQTAAAEREAALTAVLLDIARTTALDSDDPEFWAAQLARIDREYARLGSR